MTGTHQNVTLKRFLPWRQGSLGILFLWMVVTPNISHGAIHGSGLDHYMTDSRLWTTLLVHPQEWFQSDSSINIAANVLSYQRDSGGWPKNVDYMRPLNRQDKKSIKQNNKTYRSTIDNGATYSELYFIARMYTETRDNRYLTSFYRGFDYLISAQYVNGGWPQYFPLRKGYYTHITYNDDAMIGVLMLLRDVASQKAMFSFVDQERVARAQSAQVKGIDCILKTQLTRNGRATAWCAQHHEKTLEPVSARKYELVSLSGKESVGILLYLMELENPSQQIIDAINDGISWFEAVKIDNHKIIRVQDESSPTGLDQRLVPTANAPPIWARFYDIETDQPIFSDRDGMRYEAMADISSERRNEYGWYGSWPTIALKYYHEVWKEKWIDSAGDVKASPKN